MTAQTGYLKTVDPRFPGVNNSILQESPIISEVPEAMADDDTTTIQMPLTGNTYQPPQRVSVARHTGGDITSAAAATHVVSDGDTLKLQIDVDGNGTFVEYTHTFTGCDAGAATAAQMATSINADTAINDKVLAVAGLTSNAVTLFPITNRGALRVVGGTASSVLAFPGTLADTKARTYVSQTCPVIATGTGWSWSFVASTGVLTVKNETGGAVNRVTIFVQP